MFFHTSKAVPVAGLTEKSILTQIHGWFLLLTAIMLCLREVALPPRINTPIQPPGIIRRTLVTGYHLYPPPIIICWKALRRKVVTVALALVRLRSKLP